jgi:hypothetical protein
VTRKGVKKRDLSDVELREILSELLPLVRMDHVLPPSSDVLNQAIRRGLVSDGSLSLLSFNSGMQYIPYIYDILPPHNLYSWKSNDLQCSDQMYCLILCVWCNSMK